MRRSEINLGTWFSSFIFMWFSRKYVQVASTSSVFICWANTKLRVVESSTSGFIYNTSLWRLRVHSLGGRGEMTQQLSTLVVLAEHPCLLSSTLWLTTLHSQFQGIGCVLLTFSGPGTYMLHIHTWMQNFSCT